MPRPTVDLSLFWRTFVLLALLLVGGVMAWVQTLRALELEPRSVQAAQQLVALVNISSAALKSAEGSNRVALLKNLGTPQSARVTVREPSDRWEPLAVDSYSRRVSKELASSLGADAIVARSVNGREGTWVGFAIDRDRGRDRERERYWLRTETVDFSVVNGNTWLLWTSLALLATLAGSALIARLINRPLKQLSFAASRIREGDLDSRLDENTFTSEVREVNRGFNRMARELARVEEDRAVMLAGISHDLRTPLARLRLETEMSVEDDEAKRNMALDIDQLDAIINKFMDYARPGETVLSPLHLARLIDREAALFRDPRQIRITSRVAIDQLVMADEIELGRVFLNLFENARRYGRGTYTGVAEVTVTSVKTGPWVIVSVRDQGPGVAPEKLPQLTIPFFRGDAARTAATGAGLGLAIVEKAMQRMGGRLEMANAPDGGLVAHMRLKRPTADELKQSHRPAAMVPQLRA